MNFPALITYLVLAAFSPGSTAAADNRVVRFSGEGDVVTEEFKVDGPFYVLWQTERAADFRILLKGFSGGIPSIVADPAMWDGPENIHAGKASYFRGGRYFFEVRASGPWQIEVTVNR